MYAAFPSYLRQNNCTSSFFIIYLCYHLKKTHTHSLPFLPHDQLTLLSDKERVVRDDVDDLFVQRQMVGAVGIVVA